MILSEEQIKNILAKQPKKLRNKLTGEEINEYFYTDIEMLNVIQTFIYDKKGVDIGTIDRPRGMLCPSFVDLCIKRGVNPILAMSKSSDIDAMDFAFNQAFLHFKNKYDENNN